MVGKNTSFKKLKTAITLTFFILIISSQAFAEEKLKFGVPAWPGVTVKTEVVCQIFEKLGYETEQFIVSLSMVFKGLETGDINAYLAGWSPLEDSMIIPLAKKGKIEKVRANIENAISGLCVPDYVWNAGIHSIKDMVKNGDKFNKKIYCIEAGSGMGDSLEAAVKNNADNMGDWNIVNSSTSGMLSQVKSLMADKEWIVFFGWAPHWMNIEFDMEYLETSPKTQEITRRKSVVYTILPSDFSTKNKNAYKFFKQFKADSDIQSKWIYDYGFKKITPEKIAEKWIKNNKEIVLKWVEGVKSLDGRPASEVLYNKAG